MVNFKDVVICKNQVYLELSIPNILTDANLGVGPRSGRWALIQFGLVYFEV